MLIGLYLLTPIFRIFVNNCKQEHIEYFLILFFIIGTSFPLVNAVLNNLSVFKGVQIYFPANELSGYIGYYIAGYYFASCKVRKNIKTGIYILAILSILLTIIGTSLINLYKATRTGALYYNLAPNTMFVTYGVFLLFQQIFEKMKFSDKTKIMVLKTSKNTFGIFLMHALVIQMFQAIGVNTLIINPILSIPLISILVMIISLVGTIIISKVPVLNKYVV
jgi:surface polysaccharide O-acyltransferase-like enzyme